MKRREFLSLLGASVAGASIGFGAGFKRSLPIKVNAETGEYTDEGVQHFLSWYFECIRFDRELWACNESNREFRLHLENGKYIGPCTHATIIDSICWYTDETLLFKFPLNKKEYVITGEDLVVTLPRKLVG